MSRPVARPGKQPDADEGGSADATGEPADPNPRVHCVEVIEGVEGQAEESPERKEATHADKTPRCHLGTRPWRGAGGMGCHVLIIGKRIRFGRETCEGGLRWVEGASGR